MSKLLTSLVIVLFIDMAMLMAQASMTDIDSTSSEVYNLDQSVLGDFGSCNDVGSCNVTKEAKNSLPGGNPTVDSSGNIFIDAFKSLRDWFWEALGPAKFLLTMLAAPGQFTARLGLPLILAGLINIVWWGLHFFLLVAFITGRGGE